MEAIQTHWTQSIGRWWFKHRSLSPLPLFLLMVFLPPEFTPTTAQSLVAIGLVLLAEALRVWAVGYAGSATRTRGHGAPALVHAGPYRFVRNPLYVANILMYTAAAVAFGFAALAVVVFVYSCVQYTFIVQYEESLLEGLFGESYRRFRAQVPRWFGVTRAIESSGQTFDLQRALRSERGTFFSMAAMAILFALKQAWLLSH